jgi:hypothetical protein
MHNAYIFENKIIKFEAISIIGCWVISFFAILITFFLHCISLDVAHMADGKTPRDVGVADGLIKSNLYVVPIMQIFF